MKHDEFFLIAPEDVYHDIIYFKGTELKHLVQVLRKKVGDAATATDGQGNTYDFILTNIGKVQAEAEIQKRRRLVGEPFFQLTLAQAMLKSHRFEWVVEKGTEIGVSQFIPMLTEHTIPEMSPQRIERCRRIAREAAKQCCRSIIPRVAESRTLTDVFTEARAHYIQLIAHPCREALPVKLAIEHYHRKINALKLKSGILLVGPEGGFSDAEIRTALAHGFIPISLGKRRLRAETAGLVAVTLVLEHAGEY